MIKTKRYKTKDYLSFQFDGFASRFAFPFAKEVCVGNGFDIGCSKKEWSLPGSIPIDSGFDDDWDAFNLPNIIDHYCIYDSDPIREEIYNGTSLKRVSYKTQRVYDSEIKCVFLDMVRPIDYIFSSHCLEHIPDWVAALDYWGSQLSIGGTLFLYLPDYSQEYWRPWNKSFDEKRPEGRKHYHSFTQNIIRDYMIDRKYINVYASGVDLNNSFIVIGQKNI